MTDTFITLGGAAAIAVLVALVARRLNWNAPLLLIVGGNDIEVEALNRKALSLVSCEKQISIVPGAGHLFEEGRSLDTVAGLAAGWFLRHFQVASQTRHDLRPQSEHPNP